MQRYFLELSFKGTNYHGWQAQPNAISVQAEVEKALQVILREDIKITGAGRTDTGVHAGFYVAHFDTNDPLPLSGSNLVYKLNAILGRDIAIKDVYNVKPEAHARYSALSRTYHYTICQEKDPFNHEFAWYYSLPLDIELMNQAAVILFDYSDYTSFSKLHSDTRTNVCEIFKARWVRDGKQVIFVISANRFLRNMVRSIVGTMVDIGRGKLDLSDFRRIIEAKNRNLAGFSAPAHGLMLHEILYTDTIKM
jgi:tRNA pseudouridine38-40 synthase